MLTDEEVFRGCLKNDRKAQATFYQRYKSRFFGVCWRYANSREDAEDIFQEALIKVFKHIKEVRDAKDVSAWVRRIIVNTAINHYRKQVEFDDIDDLSDDVLLPFDNNDDILMQLNNKELMEVLNSVLSELPNGARIVFNMYVMEGYTHPEIAAQLQIAEGTSKSQLFFAKKYLQEKLKKKGYSAADSIKMAQV
ncbi:RNA polymerase sigma factor [Emticicia sp. C21]|uniref:RNA polymerase sigma factor n=1 Tax=Emticicia sp. C21 TaxID=2302915 RepID=UPI000E342531|nr:RNA polymerase sigma factor [Emticicia sp. C21]RFS18112.1 RNA polymerase sigma factor [Emticicia sp. C21]